MKKVMTLGLLALFTVSCTAQCGRRLKGNGNVITLERSVGEYDAIAISGWFDVNLVDGKEGELTLEGEENLLEYLKTEVKNGKLVIKTEKGVNLKPSNWKGGIIITVPVQSVSYVALSGSGDIVGKTTIKASNFETAMSGSGDITLDIQAESVEAALSGSGDIRLKGKAENLQVSVSGSGDVEAYGLEAENVEANVSGSADIQVTANEKIMARVSGSGDIKYRGNPQKVDTKTSGSGDISKG
ncbi:MAG: head GIN domain-containing protein [Bacteroidota bacterium]